MTGVFAWQPTEAGAFTVTVLVTDSSSPSFSDEETIAIVVEADTGTVPSIGDARLNSNGKTVSGISLTSNKTLDASRVQNASISLRQVGKKPRELSIQSVAYDPASHSLLITPEKSVRISGTYEVVVRDTITDLFDRALDGDADGLPGSDYAVLVGQRITYIESDQDKVAFKLSGGGAMALTLGPTGIGRDLQLFATIPDRSVLTGTVTRSRRPPIGDGIARLRSLTGAGVVNRLPSSIQVGTISANVVDRVLGRVDELIESSLR